MNYSYNNRQVSTNDSYLFQNSVIPKGDAKKMPTNYGLQDVVEGEDGEGKGAEPHDKKGEKSKYV